MLSVSKLERQRTSGTQKRSKSHFMYCRKFTFWPARHLIKEFRVLHIVKLKDETEKLNQKEKDQLHNLLSRMMGKKARSPRKMHSRVSVESGE